VNGKDDTSPFVLPTGTGSTDTACKYCTVTLNEEDYKWDCVKAGDYAMDIPAD
jgi:hypothetical protein